MPTTNTTRRTRPRVPFIRSLDEAVDDAYLAGGYRSAIAVATAELGWTPTRAQVALMVGRRAFALNQERGDQSYQLRMERAGRPMRACPARGEWLGTVPTAPAPVIAAAPTMASLDRVFGVEVEYNCGGRPAHIQRGEVVANMIAAGHPAFDFGGYAPHTTPDQWRMTTDCTVTGGEFVSPELRGREGLEAMRAALRAVKAAGGTAGRNQGLHVHHDVRDFDTPELVRLLTNLEFAEGALLAYVPDYRWNGSGGFRAERQYSGTWAAYRRDAEAGVLAWRGRANRTARNHYNRYVSVNVNPVMSQGSVEFRLLGNTLNPVKVRTWIRVGQALMQATKDGLELAGPVGPRELVAALVAAGQLTTREADAFVTVTNERTARRAA